MSIPKTANFKYNLVPFETRVWHDLVNSNFQSLDAVLARYITVTDFQGPWENSTAYTVGQNVLDEDNGTIYTCVTGHTSAASPTTFATDRTSYPGYWNVFTFQANARGAWVTATGYAVNDFVYSGNIYAICTTAHTSGATFAGDSANWGYLIDASATVAAAQAAQVAAQAAQTAAETAEANAETAETNAETAETNAAASASAASTSASNAATSETNAATSASNASTSETNASNSASAASTSASNASTSAGNAATAKTAAEAAQAAAEAAAANLPSAPGHAGLFLRVNGTADGWDYRSTAQVLSDIGAAASGHDHTGTYEPADANIVKKNSANAFAAPQRADQATVTDGTLDASTAQNWLYTPTGADTMEFTNEAAGQSGLIHLVNGSNYAITLGSEITAPTGTATTLSATGNYLVSYWIRAAGGGAGTVSISAVKVV